MFCAAFIRALYINSTETSYSIKLMSVGCGTNISVTIQYSNSSAISVGLSVILVKPSSSVYHTNVRIDLATIAPVQRASFQSSTDLSLKHLLVGLSSLSGQNPPTGTTYNSLYNSILLLNEAEDAAYPYTLYCLIIANYSCPVNAVNKTAISCVCNPVGYYELNSACPACPQYCYNCSNASSCGICIPTRTLVLNVSCPCLAGYYETNLTSCQPCLASCGTCANGTTCLTCTGTNKNVTNYCMCNDGYYMSSGTCSACLVACSLCVSGSVCLNCADNTTRNVTTQNCMCKIGFYEQSPSAVLCLPCSYQCYTCSGASTSCTRCAQGTERNLNATTTCGCNPGFYDPGVINCSACYPTCLTCNGGTNANCQSCISSQNRNLNGSTCSCNFGWY